MIKSYANELAWTSATKSTTESTVGILLDSKTPVLNGVNVLVTNPKVGDAVVLDANNEIKFIALDTFVNSAFPSGWTKVGVVYNVRGKEISIVSYTSLGRLKYSAIYRLKITGYTLDGASHSAILRSYSNSGTYTDLSFTYSASDKAGLVSQFNTWAATSGNDPNGRGFSMYVDSDGNVELVESNYITWYQHYDSFISGLTSSINLAQEVPNVSWNLDMDGYSRIYNTVNIGAVKRWGGRTLGSIEDVSANDIPISEASFNGSYGINYRAIYSSYDEYLEHNCAKVPCNSGVVSLRDKGYEYTYALANATYKTKDGEDAYMYTAPHSIATFGFSSNVNIAPGKWYIPDVEEMIILMRPITVGNIGISTLDQYDAVNRTIYAMGGSTINTNAYRWCGCRYDGSRMWSYRSYGGLDGDGFYVALVVIPVCRLLIL